MKRIDRWYKVRALEISYKVYFISKNSNPLYILIYVHLMHISPHIISFIPCNNFEFRKLYAENNEYRSFILPGSS